MIVEEKGNEFLEIYSRVYPKGYSYIAKKGVLRFLTFSQCLMPCIIYFFLEF